MGITCISNARWDRWHHEILCNALRFVMPSCFVGKLMRGLPLNTYAILHPIWTPPLPLLSACHGYLNGSRPLNLTRQNGDFLNLTQRHEHFLNLTQRHEHFLKLTCDMGLLVTCDTSFLPLETWNLTNS